ncbi:MAG TPA: AMP-binding protein [Candidatus Alistipes avicola]|uniref:AMP-binding protein n=1 Tax=Candidatus Alistipes avicola TaxID=2838432 RepID=A0A9D2L3X0_9BACT|nr:AMP-binding protein [uncultured Alistipes sp.]HJA98649.1 AMP-binding protein [Candidatus Alistipes avicola]
MKKTIIDLFESSVAKYGDKTFLLEKRHHEFQPTTYAETKEQALEVGAGLASLGIRPKDKVAILGEGNNAWIISELGLFYAGAISVPLSVKLEESNDLLFRLRHAEVKALFVSKQQLPKIRRIREQIPQVEHIIVFGHIPLENGEMAYGTLKRLGRDYLSQHREEFLKIGAAIQNDDFATITYTSGTTADPKGVVLTHRNYTANVEQSLSRIDIPSSYRTLIILPLDHCFAHVVGFYIMIACGASVATVQIGATPMETLKNIPINIREVKPHFLLSVPALAKNFRKSIETSIRAKGRFTEWLFHLALKVSYAYNQDGYHKGKGWRVLLSPIVGLFDAILFRKVREAFGGSLEFFVGGGALLDSELQRFFYAIGIPMFQGYGLSEATPVISTNSPKFHEHKFGSSGKIIEPLDLKIVDAQGKELPRGEKGEIIIRGENVMAEYWKNPEATAETLRDGWLHTGDMGYVSEDDFLYVLGRFKSLLIASDGEKYSPEGMEEAIVDKSPFIDQILIHNNQDPFTGAIVVPNAEALRHELDKRGVKEGRAEAAADILGAEIDRYRAEGPYAGEFPERWLPAGLAIVEEHFTEKNGLVNSTMKVVRNKVEERFKDRIEYLYTGEGRKLRNEKNLEALRKIMEEK